MKSALVLTLLYLPYMLMLRRESFFRFNRFVLLGILVLSLVLPLCNVPGLSLDRQPVVQAAQRQMLEMGMPVHVLPEVLITPEGETARPQSAITLFMLVSLIYIIGVVVVLLVRGLQIYSLQSGLRRGSLWTQREGDMTIYCHGNAGVSSFSWMKSIVLSETDYQEAGHQIVLHETGHIRNRHSLDVLLLTLVEMLQWWNPLAYMLGISLRDVHEYEADDYVLSCGVSPTEYQLLLIKKAVGSGSYAFANNFNHSLTKKRITMMKKSKSNPWMRGKALYILPVATLALSAFATPKFVAPVESAVSNLAGKVTEKSAISQTSEEKSAVTAPEDRKVVHVKEGTMRVKVDGKEMTPEEALKAVRGKEIKNSLITGSDGSTILSIKTEAPDKGTNGAFVNETRDGQLGDELDIKDLVKKLPGAELDDDGNIKLNGKSVSRIMLDDKQVYVNKDSIYDVVAHLPEFPSGEVAFYKFLAENIRYPKLCQEFGFQGRVVMQFIVEKDGSISGITKQSAPGKKLSQVNINAYKTDHPDSKEKLEVGQDLGDLLVEESVRVLKLMPKWKPGRDDKGEVVRTRFNVPFMYRLQ